MNLRPPLALLLTALALASSAEAAPPPVEHFFKLPAFQEATLSPSGRRLALTAPGPNGRIGLFVVDLQGTEFKATRAALLGAGDVSTFEWVDDERLVFTEVDLRAGLAEARRRAPGLYAVRHDGEEPTYLVEVEGRAFVTDGSRYRTLPWNHELLHVPLPSEDRAGARADEVIVGELVFGNRELREVRPLWLNTRNGRTRDFVVAPPPCKPLRWWFSAQGQPRLIHCITEDRSSMHWLDRPRDGQPARWTSIGESPRGWLPFEPLWVGQDDTLMVEATLGRAGESVVARFDFTDKAPGKVLVQAPGFDVDATLIGDRQGQRLLGVRLSTDAEQTVWFDPAMKAAQQRADEALPGRVNRIECRRCGGDDAVMLVRSFSDRDPGQLLLWRQADNGGKGRWQRVGPMRRDIVPEQMAATDLHRIQARDGRDLPVWVTRPNGPREPAPAVVLVHGGPWVRGRHWDWQAMPQFLASRGYVVIEPEFRGSAGYGMAHLKAGFRQWGQAMQDDVADALLWARRQGLAGEAACIVGSSYGGYSALMGLVRHAELYRCASAQVAVTDLLLMLEGAWWVQDDLSVAARSHSLPEKVGDPQKDREMLLANSPVVQAARITRPLQLMWGLDDRRVPITHGRRLRDAMQKAGQQPEWIVYDDEAHGLGKVEHQVDFAKKLEAFLGRHLRGDGAAR